MLVGSDFATVAELAEREFGESASAARWRARRGPASSQAAKEIAEQGTFTSLARAVPFDHINATFAVR